MELAQLKRRLLHTTGQLLPRPLQPEHEKDHAFVFGPDGNFYFTVEVQGTQRASTSKSRYKVHSVEPWTHIKVDVRNRQDSVDSLIGSVRFSHLQRAWACVN